MCHLTDPLSISGTSLEFLSVPGDSGGRHGGQRRDCCLPLSQHSPGTPARVNSSGPSGALWLLPLHSVWSQCVPAGQNWAMLWKFEQTRTEALHSSSLNGEEKSLFKLAVVFKSVINGKLTSFKGFIRNSTSAESLQLFSL